MYKKGRSKRNALSLAMPFDAGAPGISLAFALAPRRKAQGTQSCQKQRHSGRKGHG